MAILVQVVAQGIQLNIESRQNPINQNEMETKIETEMCEW